MYIYIYIYIFHHRDTAEVHSARLPDGSEATNVTACGPLSKLLKLLKARSWPSITAARFTMFELSDCTKTATRSALGGSKDAMPSHAPP